MSYALFLCVPAGPICLEIESQVAADAKGRRDSLEVVGIHFSTDQDGLPVRLITYRLNLSDPDRARMFARTYADHVVEPWQSGRRIGLRRVTAAVTLALASLANSYPPALII